MKASLNFGVDVVLEDSADGHWTAKVETLGLVVHADTESEVRTRVRQAMTVLMEVFSEDPGKARRFLDHHQIESTLTMEPNEPVSYRQQHRERWQHEVAGVVLA